MHADEIKSLRHDCAALSAITTIIIPFKDHGAQSLLRATFVLVSTLVPRLVPHQTTTRARLLPIRYNALCQHSDSNSSIRHKIALRSSTMASNASQASAGADAAPVLEAGPLALGDPASSSIAEAEPSAPTSSASNSLGTSASPSAPTQSTPAITPIPTTTSSAPSFSSASQARASTNSAQIAPQPSTASMLPRSTASLPAAAYVSAASSSSASSGSATPTNRPHTSTTSPYTVSPRRASSSLAQHLPSFSLVT